jgi:hypothetical protein
VIHRTTSALLAAALALALAGCSTAGTSAAPVPGDAPDAAADGSVLGDGSALGDGHGEIAGAQEMAEPQAHLLTVDETGAIAHLDLLDETMDELGSFDDVESLTTEGRYAYAVRPGSDAVSIVDSGVWTWSHIDHFHYYRAEPRVLGDVEGAGSATVSASDSGAGVFFPESGEAVLLAAETLGDGSLDEAFRLEVEPHDGLLVPVGTRAIVTEPDADPGTGELRAARVRALDADGGAGESAECLDARGTITTVVGVVIGCLDGALLAVAGDDGEIAFERIPYPEGTTVPRAEEFGARESRPTVAGLAGRAGSATAFWLLDTRERAWRLIDAGESIVRVTAVDDADQHVLALSADGRVLVFSGETGARLAATEPLLAWTNADAARLGGVALIADQHRAYVNGVAERRLYEIDFADAARVSREFEMAGEPSLMIETGR